MRRWEIVKGSPKKEDHGPWIEWLPIPFGRRPLEPPPEMEWKMIENRVVANLCVRCGGKFEKQKDGRIVCKGCGLWLNETVRQHYGYKKWWQI